MLILLPPTTFLKHQMLTLYCSYLLFRQLLLLECFDIPFFYNVGLKTCSNALCMLVEGTMPWLFRVSFHQMLSQIFMVARIQPREELESARIVERALVSLLLCGGMISLVTITISTLFLFADSGRRQRILLLSKAKLVCNLWILPSEVSSY